MVPATAAPHCLLLRAHSRPLPPSHAPMPAGDREDPDAPTTGTWLRLGLATSSQEDAAPEGSLEFDLFAPAGRAPPPAMDLFPTHPASGAGPRCGPHWADMPAAGELRVVAVPPQARPPVGLWFALRAAQSQILFVTLLSGLLDGTEISSRGKEASLPQLRKSYLRIKDGRMTVRLLMKYLVCKLGLRHESEEGKESIVGMTKGDGLKSQTRSNGGSGVLYKVMYC